MLFRSQRVQIVYRSFVSTLSLYLKHTDEIKNTKEFISKTGFVSKIVYSFKGSRHKSIVSRNIYPREIELERLKIQRENILVYRLEALRHIKINSEYVVFSKYLGVQPLVMEGRILDREKIEKLMNKLERLH